MYAILLMVFYGANEWNEGLTQGCRGGHMQVVQYMRSKGANDWRWSFTYACRGGNMEIIYVILRQDLHNWSIAQQLCAWNTGLLAAVRGGHIEIVNLLLAFGAFAIELPLTIAMLKNNAKIVELLRAAKNKLSLLQ